MKIQRALISVSDKRGVAGFARQLAEMEVELLATGGTKALLLKEGIAVREVSEVTGFPEMMDGRVKTLHPKVHGGILALRDEAAHVDAMREHGIGPIDMVVVNLYPFEETVARPGVSRAEAIEKIDIGGPSMVRSAAKNHAHVAIVTDPADYDRVLADLKERAGTVSAELKRELGRKAFALTARYDAAISRWLMEADGDESLPESLSLGGAKALELRYGENPHQKAAFYRSGAATSPGAGPSLATAEVLGGKALSYNNLVDLDSALALACEFADPFAAVLKHNNPCGAACGATLREAIEGAWAGDPLSAFGSVLAFTRPVDRDTADFLVSGNRFVEAIVAPSFEPDALEMLQNGPKWGKNVRLLAAGPIGPEHRRSGLQWKDLAGGFLVQTADCSDESAESLELVTQTRPTAEQLEAMLFANLVCKHVKSNAIVLATEKRVLGVGAGQMSRVDSVKLAVEKAGDEARGSVLASDAFFPFADGVEAAMEAGVVALIQPGGSIRDKEVIAACDKQGVGMAFSRVRHFRH